jgi:hypothetical protein
MPYRVHRYESWLLLMTFGMFAKAKQPPLAEFCTELSVPENLIRVAKASARTDKRAVALSLTIMAAAGFFLERFHWDRGAWKSSRRYLRDTNLDVITAEAIVWVHSLLGKLWLNDVLKDHEMIERIGPLTFFAASKIVLHTVEAKTGFDFEKEAIERRRFYLEELKDHKIVEAFATVLLRSVGRMSLAEPLRTADELLPPLERMPIVLNVNTFFATMPLRYYKAFKGLLKERPDLLPPDENPTRKNFPGETVVSI